MLKLLTVKGKADLITVLNEIGDGLKEIIPIPPSTHDDVTGFDTLFLVIYKEEEPLPFT